MTQLSHRQVPCPECIAYRHCADIEREWGASVRADLGNWRNLYRPGGGRIGTPIRRCTRAMLDVHGERFRHARVLEIGCGPTSDLTGAFCRRWRVRYLGVDPERLPPLEIPWLPYRGFQHRVTRRLGLVMRTWRRRFRRLPFPSPEIVGPFDLIYSSNSFEHLHEDLTDRNEALAAYRRDIRACLDLLRPGGVLLCNVPIHLHGNRLFVLGDVGTVAEMFGDEWASVTFEHWRENHGELMPYAPGPRKAAMRVQYGVELTNIWLLNIVAVKPA